MDRYKTIAGATLIEYVFVVTLLVLGLLVFRDSLIRSSQEFHEDHTDFDYAAMKPLLTIPPPTATATSEVIDSDS